jgi:hypothetical protein
MMGEAMLVYERTRARGAVCACLCGDREAERETKKGRARERARARAKARERVSGRLGRDRQKTDRALTFLDAVIQSGRVISPFSASW